MYEPHRPYPFAALCVFCLALCADSALANGATGGWGEGAPPAVPDRGFTYSGKCFVSPETACKVVASTYKDNVVYISHSMLSNGMALCRVGPNPDGTNAWHVPVASCKRPDKGFDPDPAQPEPPKPPESGGGGDFGGGGASGDWEEDPKKPDEDKEDQKEDPKDPDPDFGDLGDIPKPPIPPPTPPASGPNVNVGVGVNVPGPCTGAAAGTVGCMKPGAPSGEVLKPRNVDAGKDVDTRPVSSSNHPSVNHIDNIRTKI